MKTIDINGTEWVYCYGKAKGKQWTMIYYPKTGYEAQTPQKKSPSKSEDTILDNLWSKLVKQRAGNKCEYCGSTKALNSHHIITRSNKRLRWELDNGICLCAYHHTLSSNFSAHKNPAKFQEWIGEKRLNELQIIGNAKGQKIDKKAVYRYLKEMEGKI